MKYIMPVGTYLEENKNATIGVTVFISMFLKCLRLKEENLNADFVKKFVPSYALAEIHPKTYARSLVEECFGLGESLETNETWLNTLDKDFWIETSRYSSENIHELKNKIMILNFVLKDHFHQHGAIKNLLVSRITELESIDYLMVEADRYDAETCLKINRNCFREDDVIFIPVKVLTALFPYFGFTTSPIQLQKFY